MRGATLADIVVARPPEFQLTHLLRGATDSWRRGTPAVNISTHAPLAKCDEKIRTAYELKSISTHAPLARCDDYPVRRRHQCHISTHAPLARCDPGRVCPFPGSADFNSRTSCEVRRTEAGAFAPIRGISTHAPLARCDMDPPTRVCDDGFQLTHLLRGATIWQSSEYAPRLISTHAPLARCDHHVCDFRDLVNPFQLTHLLRGATVNRALRNTDKFISTHAPLARCDDHWRRNREAQEHFNSRTSCEVRRERQKLPAAKRYFNSRTSCEVRPGQS